MTITVDGDAVSLKYAGINMAGKVESGTTTLYADGLEHEVSPLAPGFVAQTRWQDPLLLETEARKDGRVVGKGSYALSDDSKTMTATICGIDAAGAEFEQIIVFDRVETRYRRRRCPQCLHPDDSLLWQRMTTREPDAFGDFTPPQALYTHHYDCVVCGYYAIIESRLTDPDLPAPERIY